MRSRTRFELLSAIVLATLAVPVSAQPGAPTISTSPAGAEYPAGTVLTVSVAFCDNAGLDTASRTLTVNNANVAQSFTKSLTYETAGPCYARFVQTGQVTVPSTIRASIEDNTGLFSRLLTFSFVSPTPWAGIRVVAEDVYLDAAPASAQILRFHVHNLGAASQTVALTAVTDSLSNVGAPSQTSVNLLAESSTQVTVAATARSSDGQRGRVWLRAVAGSLRDSAFAQLTSTPVAALSNGVTLINPTGILDHSLCVSVAVGPGAALECGDLRLTYALPQIHTRDRARAPSLIYHSNTAHPFPAIAANLSITAPVGGETYTATVVFTAGGPLAGQSFAAGSWAAAD